MIDEAVLRSVIDFEDAAGVLSLYAGFTPEQAADPQPTAPIELRNQLSDLRQRLREEDADVLAALEQRLEELGDTLGGLLDPKAHGRGRALFVGIDAGHRKMVSLQMPFRERVVCRDRAYVRPLVAAHDEGRPAGIIVVHRNGVRILEWSVGEAEELATRDFEVGDAQLADIKSGPSGNNPQRAQQGLINRESFEDRIDENRHRFLKEAAGELVQLASDRGWDRVVVAGAPKVRQQLHAELPDRDNGFERLLADQSWETATEHTIAEQAWPLLRSVHRQREVDLVEQVKSRTLSGGSGALGLADTLAAVNQGRVAHLVFDADLEVDGYRSAEDTLHADPADAEGFDVEPERLLIERAVEKVIEMGGAVTPVDEQAAGLLGEHGSIGALLRW